MKKISLIIAGILLLGIAFTACNNGTSEQQQVGTTADSTAVQTAEVYQCPMKCEGEKTYDQMGKCPVCGMDLAKVEKK